MSVTTNNAEDACFHVAENAASVERLVFVASQATGPKLCKMPRVLCTAWLLLEASAERLKGHELS